MRIDCAPEVRGSQEGKIIAGPAGWRAPAAQSNPTSCLKTAVHFSGSKTLGVSPQAFGAMLLLMRLFGLPFRPHADSGAGW